MVEPSSPQTLVLPVEPSETATAASRVTTLHTISWLITSSGITTHTFGRISAELHKWLSFNSIAIGLVNEAGNQFELRYGNTVGYARPGKDYGFDRHNSTYGWVIDRHRLLFMPDIREEPQFSEHPRMIANGIRARVVAPLISQNEVLGAIGLSSHSPRAFTLEDVELIAVLADAMAMGLRTRALLQQTARLEALEEADRIRSLMLSTVSHELRTPLGLIRGYLGVTLQDQNNPLFAEQREYLQIALEETDRLTELVDSLLDMSGLQAGSLPIHVETAQPALMIHEALRRLRPLISSNLLEVSVEPGLPLILADKQRIGQVLRNLLENAVRYTPPGTGIRVTATQSEGSVVIRVADDGPGIAQDKLEQLFLPFSRIADCLPPDHIRRAGLGLGLAICRGIVEAHGGRIWVDTEPGLGSTFSFSLPAKPNARVVPVRRSHRMRARTQDSVLVVEDESRYARLLSIILSREGFSVRMAATAAAAMKFVAEEPSELILLDLGLPDQDGKELCRSIRQFSDTPIIVITAQSGVTSRVMALNLGADDYITKPFAPEELVARVRAVLRRTKPRPAKSETRVFQAGELVVDLVLGQVTVGGSEIQLTSKEYQLLGILVQHANQVLLPDVILEHVWGPAYRGDHYLVRLYVSRLRRKIADDPRKPRYIETRAGIGYRFLSQASIAGAPCS